MPQLDVRTLSLITVLILLLMAGAMVLLWRTSPEERSAPLWAGGNGLISLGVLFIGLRNLIPDLFSIPLANTLIVAGALLLLAGIWVFFDRPVRWRTMAALSALTLLVFLYLTYVAPDLRARIVWTSLCVAGIGGWMAWELVRDFDRRMGLPQGLVTLVVLLYSAFLVVRAVLTLTGKPIEDLMEMGTTVHALAFLLGMVASICLTFGFSAMINRRLHLHLDHLASHDLLTGMHNRRAFEEATERELARSRRHGEPLSVLLLDLDHFKQVARQQNLWVNSGSGRAPSA